MTVIKDIAEETLSSYAEIVEFRERLAVAFERDDAGREIVVEWRDADAPTDDPIGGWEDDGGYILEAP